MQCQEWIFAILTELFKEEEEEEALGKSTAYKACGANLWECHEPWWKRTIEGSEGNTIVSFLTSAYKKEIGGKGFYLEWYEDIQTRVNEGKLKKELEDV